MDWTIQAVSHFKAGLQKIDDLLNRLRGSQLHSLADLWQLERDLVEYLIQVQTEISLEREAQGRLKREIAVVRATQIDSWKARHKALSQDIALSKQRESNLKLLHTYAKQIGDALAYFAFRLDWQRITSLCDSKVPTRYVPTGYSLQAMIGVAEHLAPNAGFPVLHDITTLLKVGDITFSHPDHGELLTVEVKAGKLTEVEDNQGKLEVKLYALGSADRFRTAVLGPSGASMVPDQISIPLRREKVFNPQLSRQLERMAFAKKIEAAQENEVFHVQSDGTRHLAVKTKIDRSSTHWDVINQIVKEACEKGFAGQTVDDAFLYFATYCEKDDLHFQSRFELPYAAEMGQFISEFSRSTRTSGADLFFDTSWRHILGTPPEHIRPLFAYELPLKSILDILWRRLTIYVFVSLPRVFEHLAAAGIFLKRSDEIDGASKSGTHLVKEQVTHDGLRPLAGVSSIRPMLDSVTLEFVSLDTVVATISQTFDAMFKASATDPESLRALPDDENELAT